MKNFRLFIITLLALVVIGCSDDGMNKGSSTNTAGKKQTAVEHAEKHLDPNYVCPMHPQIVRGEPGNCPICGMELVKVEAENAASSKENKILYWVAPMDPAYRRDGPGKSPMGMDLVPVYDEGDGINVKISPAVENNMGVRTAIIERSKLWRKINTVGYIDFDENKITQIHLRTKGWLERLHVKSEGERVKKGQLLFEVYSPELVNAQEEYVQALRSSNNRLVNASKERLIALGISARQTKELTEKRKVSQLVKVYASQDGIVSKLNVRQGMFVMPNKEVMSLAELSTIWILAEVFESQANWVKEGQAADVTLSYAPGRTWEGKVEYIYPSLNAKTRTLKVRLAFANPDELLKPNMFANVTIYGGAKQNIIIAPREAIIRTGENSRVILAMGKGRFQPRDVVVGIESGDWIEIQSGLKEGDKVVTSGQFLIDSEASLKASLKRMTNPKPAMTEMKNMPANETKNKEMQSKITGTGIVREIMATENKVNMSHDPIPAIGWAETDKGMTMPFKVKPDVSLKDFKAQDKVEFDLEKGADGYEIKAIRKVMPDMKSGVK